MNEMIANHSESAVHEDARKCTIRENGLNEQQQTAP